MAQEADVPRGLWGRIEQLIDRKIAEFARSGFLRNASISGGKGLTIKGGTLRVLFPDSQGGLLGVYFGDVYSVVDGTYQGTGLMIQDTDGSDIATFRSDVASGQPIAIIRDGSERAVLYTDTITGQGFGRPWWPGVFYRARNNDWPSTSSGTFETMFRAKVNKQNPRLLVRAWGFNTGAGATGELRVMVNGTQLATTAATNSSSVTEFQFFGDVAGNFGDTLVVEVQARLASGTGAVQVCPSECLGRN